MAATAAGSLLPRYVVAEEPDISHIQTAPRFTPRWLSAAEGAVLVGESPIPCAVGGIARVAACLEFEQLGVEPTKSHELIVATVLEHSSLVQHIDPIRPADG